MLAHVVFIGALPIKNRRSLFRSAGVRYHILQLTMLCFTLSSTSHLLALLKRSRVPTR